MSGSNYTTLQEVRRNRSVFLLLTIQDLLFFVAGVFAWLQQQGRLAALVRQISNPMAGVDTTLLALAGTGFSSRRAFGFMSCERVVGAAEGMNVLRVSFAGCFSKNRCD
jgi:hypothetical protein